MTSTSDNVIKVLNHYESPAGSLCLPEEGEINMTKDYTFGGALPVAPLRIAALKSCQDLGKKVDDYIVQFRKNDYKLLMKEQDSTLGIRGYDRDSYLIECDCPRFGSGEGKGVINSSVRGSDLFVMVDVMNHSLTYNVCGNVNHMSPDDHFADLKRIISTAQPSAHRINVIMPFLYESRQHKRTKRESLDCAYALEELVNMGIDSIITFDAHDPRVQNAIPLFEFNNFMPTYQFLKTLFQSVPDLKIDKDHVMVISPDEGAMSRAVYLANNIGVDMGMFYKRRDYSRIVDGRNPIVAHEFLGSNVDGKDVLIIDDMISSGESMIDTAKELKKRNANRIFVVSTFGLFTNGFDSFDKAYEEGLIYRVVTTNLIYQSPELLSKEYYISCDMSKYIAYLIDTLNHDCSISDLLSPYDRIKKCVKKYNDEQKAAKNQ